MKLLIPVNHSKIGYILLLISVLSIVTNAADDDNSACAADTSTDVGDFITNGGFILLVIAVMISLWTLALVCEEFFVPALQVLCRKWKVPDSVAGSLIMAAGNNAVCIMYCITVLQY